MRDFIKRESRGVYILLGAIIVLGAMLRSYQLFEKSLWMDELFSAWASDPENDFNTVFHRTVEDVHPPLYQILLWGIYKVFGYGEMVGRVFSVVLGVAVIPMMYVLGRKLYCVEVGLLAALFSAINFYLIVFSQNTRSYELLVLLTVVSFVLFFDLVKKRKFSTALCYAVACAALVNTHYFGFLPVMSQAIFLIYLSCWPRFNKRLFVLGGGAGLFILVSIIPIFIYILKNLKKTDTWIPVPDGSFILDSLLWPFGDPSAALLSLVFLFVGLDSLIKNDRERMSLSLLLSWWFVGYSIAYVKSLFSTPVLSIKNVIVFVPAMLVIVAYGVGRIKDCFAKGVVLVFMVVVSIACFLTRSDLAESLRLEHDLRSPALEIINSGKNIPVYARWDTLHATYFKLLGAPIDVTGLDAIERDLATGTAPTCFFMIADQWDRERINNYPNVFAVELKDKAEFKNSAVLQYCASVNSPERR